MTGDVIGTLGVIAALGFTAVLCKAGILPTDEPTAEKTRHRQPVKPKPQMKPKPKPQIEPEVIEAVMVIRSIEVERPKATPKPQPAKVERSEAIPEAPKPAKAPPQPAKPPVDALHLEAREALMALGYKAKAADEALVGTSGSVEDRIKQALRGGA